MSFKQINSFLRFTHLLKLIVGLAISIQIVVISYNHFSGYYVIDGYLSFFSHLLIGSFFSLLSGFLISYPDLFIIQYMNRIEPWGKNLIKRISIELLFTVFIAALISVLLTLLIHFIHKYEEGIASVLITNALIYIVINVIVVAIFEAWIFFIESDRAKQKADLLQQELSQIKFEVLKSQINPHFLFNSLNVLSGLINSDVAKAQLFIDEFSQIYRYVLETIEQPVVTLGKELDFMRSYLFLQQIRYGESLTYSVDIIAKQLQLLVPPLSLQVLLENAMKHNIVNEEKPLKIEIYSDGDFLNIKNLIQPKISGTSTGLGLKNLIKRYALISKLEPIFKVENNYYIAKIPLIKVEQDECADN